MRIAVSYDPATGMVAEHFGHAEFLKLYTEDDGVVFTDVMPSPANGHDGVTAFLASQGVDVVICDQLRGGARCVVSCGDRGISGGIRPGG